MKLELPPQDLLALFEAMPVSAARPCLLAGRAGEGFDDTLAWDPVAVLEGHCSAELDPSRELERFVAEHSARGRLCVGYCSYELGRHLRGLPLRSAHRPGLPDYCWLAYDSWLTHSAGVWTLCARDERFKSELALARERAAHAPASAPASFDPIVFAPSLSRDEYGAAYARIAEYIRAGDIYQVNLTYQLHGRSAVAGRRLFPFVARSNPVEHLAYLEGHGYSIHSASPERFVRVRDRAIETLPIKGTRPRGATPEQDRAQLAALLGSEKEAAELNMITDLLRNDLAEVCVPGSVQVVENRVARAGPAVWHTQSCVRARLRDGIEPFAAVLRMLPGGSISGCPKRRALQIIDELEPVPRGVYTGIIGRIGPERDADFSVAIRTLVQQGEDVCLCVGGGIVYDSVFEEEHAETLLKAASFANLPSRLSEGPLVHGVDSMARR